MDSYKINLEVEKLDELRRINRLKTHLATYGLKKVGSSGIMWIWSLENGYFYAVDVSELLVKKKGKWQYKDINVKHDVLAIRDLNKD